MNATALSQIELDFVAAVLVDPTQFRLVSDLDPDNLLDPTAKTIWRIAYRYEGKIGAAPLYEELKTFDDGRKVIALYPDISDFRGLWIQGRTAGSAVTLAETLRQQIVARQIDDILVYRDISLEPSKQALQTAQKLIAAASRVAPATNAHEFMDAVDRQVDAFIWRQHNPHATLGWKLNEYQYDRFLKNTGGLDGGKLFVTAALTGMGKSHWLLFQAVRFAETMRDDVSRFPKVAFFSMEMSREDISSRLLSHFSQVEYYSISENPEAIKKIETAQVRIKELSKEGRLQVYYGINNIDAIARKLNQLRLAGEVDIAVIDYIGMIQSATPGRSTSTYQSTGDIVKQLQSLALELDMPIITASQLNRSTYEQAGQRPSLANIADSSIVTMCADVIHMLWRPDQSVKNLVGRNIGLWKDVVVLLTEKTRQGKHQSPMYYHLNSAFSQFTPCPPDLVSQLESEEQQTLLNTGFK